MAELVAPQPWHRSPHRVLRRRILVAAGVASFTDGRDDDERGLDGE